MTQLKSLIIVTQSPSIYNELATHFTSLDISISQKLFSHFNTNKPDAATVLIIDATDNATDALETLKHLARQRASARTVVLGERVDLSLVAKALIYNASRYGCLTTTTEEWLAILRETHQGSKPQADSLVGRVRSRLPVRRDLHTYARPSGQELSKEDAIRECIALGLSCDDISSHLGLDASYVSGIIRDLGLSNQKTQPLTGVALQVKKLLEPLSKAGTEPRQRKFVRGVGWLLLAFAACAVAIALRAPRDKQLAGKVLYNEMPLKCGIIRFQPAGGGRISAGDVTNGKFVVSNLGCDGGQFQVTVAGYTGEAKQVGPVLNPLGDRVFEKTVSIETTRCDDNQIILDLK